jgi:hypothetical protein
MEGHMDWGFWLGVSALILAIPLGVITNLLTPRVMSFLERRKLIKTHKSRRQALQIYNRMRAFREGRSDRYAFYILWGSFAVIAAIAASTFAILFVLVDPPTLESQMLSVAGALLCGLVAFTSLATIYDTARKLEHIDKYKAEFEARWGPIEDKDLTD